MKVDSLYKQKTNAISYVVFYVDVYPAQVLNISKHFYMYILYIYLLLFKKGSTRFDSHTSALTLINTYRLCFGSMCVDVALRVWRSKFCSRQWFSQWYIEADGVGSGYYHQSIIDGDGPTVCTVGKRKREEIGIAIYVIEKNAQCN